MTERKGSEEPKPKLKPSSKSDDLDPSNVLNPVPLPTGFHDYRTLYDDDDEYPFIKLLEAINMQAADLPLQDQFPKMDLSALYCLGITIQEYARHLSTNILTQKRASENLPSLNTLFNQQELDSRELPALIEKYKPRTKIQPTPPINARPNIEQETSREVRKKKSYMDHHQFNLDTTKGDSYYEEMMRQSEWKGQLRKNRDPEAAAAAAKLRRENNDILIKKRKLEKALKLKQQQQQIIPDEQQQIKQERLLPPTPPADIFDMSSFQQKKKSSSSSSSPSPKKKRKVTRGAFF